MHSCFDNRCPTLPPSLPAWYRASLSGRPSRRGPLRPLAVATVAPPKAAPASSSSSSAAAGKAASPANASAPTFQEAIARLQDYWAKAGGCVVWLPHNTEVGAGTMNPATFLRVLGPEPWNVCYPEPSVRPDDSRYGDNPNRVQRHTQFQVDGPEGQGEGEGEGEAGWLTRAPPPCLR